MLSSTKEVQTSMCHSNSVFLIITINYH